MQVADLDRQPLDRRGDDGEGREEHRVAVARDDLRRGWFDDEAEFGGDMLLNRRRHIGKGADRAGDCAGGDVVAGVDEAVAVALELGIGLRELEAEGHRLGVDSVAAADGRRQLTLQRPALQHFEQVVEVGDQQVGGLLELHGEGGVEHVRTGHALMKPTALGPELLACPGQEGDDVMLGDRLDRVDRRYVDVAESIVVVGGSDGLSVVGRDHPDAAHRLGREHFDLPPDSEAVLGRPDGRHFGARVAGDHGVGG